MVNLFSNWIDRFDWYVVCSWWTNWQLWWTTWIEMSTDWHSSRSMSDRLTNLAFVNGVGYSLIWCVRQQMSICHLTSLVLTQVPRSLTTPQGERWDAKMMWWWLWFSDWWVCWHSNPHRLGHASKQRNRETWERVCRPQPLLKRWDWVNAGDWGM